MVVEASFPNLPDLKTDIQIDRLENLLKANERLDLLRDRAEYIQLRYGNRPHTFYEMCASDKSAPQAGLSPRMAAVLGVGLGALAVFGYRNVWPKRHDFSYLGGAVTGGSVGFAARQWKDNAQELTRVEQRLQRYETYLNDFEHAMQAHLPPPEPKGFFRQPEASPPGRGL